MTEELQAFLDCGAYFEGKISFTGVVRIDGHLKGDVRGQGTLVVGETGVVEATLDVQSLIVRGSVSGNARAKERVEVGPTGRIEGSLSCPIIRVEEGARITAQVSMGETPTSKP